MFVVRTWSSNGLMLVQVERRGDMTLHKKVIAKEVPYLVLFLALGLVSTPWYGRVHTHTAFDKYWNDLVDYRILIRLRLLMPYFAFQSVRSIAWSLRAFRKKSSCMSAYRRVMAREWLYFVLFVALGLVCTPLLFYQGTTLVSILDGTTYTVTAFDKFWDDFFKFGGSLQDLATDAIFCSPIRPRSSLERENV